MKKIKIILFILAFVQIFLLKNTYSRNYNKAVGLRIGWTIGINGRYFFDQSKAIEGILEFWGGGFTITGLYEVHNYNLNIDHLTWYYGGGIHLGYWDTCSALNVDCGSGFLIGIDGVLGLEYKFKDVPISVGVDWQPGINFSKYSGFWLNNIGIFGRYIF